MLLQSLKRHHKTWPIIVLKKDSQVTYNLRYVFRPNFSPVQNHGMECAYTLLSSDCNISCVLNSIYLVIKRTVNGEMLAKDFQRLSSSIALYLPEVLEAPMRKPSIQGAAFLSRSSILLRLNNDLLPRISMHFQKLNNLPQVLSRYDHSIRSLARLYSVNRIHLAWTLQQMNDQELERVYLSSEEQYLSATALLTAFEGHLGEQFDVECIYVCMIAIIDRLRKLKDRQFIFCRYAVQKTAFSLGQESSLIPPPYHFVDQ